VNVLVALAVLVILAVVVWFVGAPLRGRAVVAEEQADAAAREELEAVKEAKYREIRDAELDHATGKLDEEDWRAIDRQLRAQAVQILREIERLGSEAPASDR
jgi:Na+-transporting methylmalonyl-CoA/oxaloacetate decarboxylase gamma subunit